ncbi:hypothetical protein B484DRAFT_407932 [Ochromonadaceae sp. CCMP2298]|nr:hypothetical protein B484DRAFT_407932 [Ochromonadaceae sp. CCMP2298]
MPLLEAVRAARGLQNPSWHYLSRSNGVNMADISVPAIYRSIAVKIRIYGLQPWPSEDEHLKAPFVAAVQEALGHFASVFGSQAQDVNRVRKLVSCFLVTHDHFDQLSLNWQSVVRDVGEYVAGDEKLLKFFGAAGDIVKVDTKPDKVGLWFYELVAKDKHGRMFLLDTKLQCSHCGSDTITLASIVKRWAQVIFERGQPQCILASDSHYMTKEGRAWLNSESGRLQYTASVRSDHFKPLVGLAQQLFLLGPQKKKIIAKPGDWTALYNPVTGESFVYAWDVDKNVGKKYNLSNCVVKAARRNKHDTELRNLKGPYDLYKACFNLCDLFNRALHDKKWPFKRGGRDSTGEWGHQDNWALTATLQNTFNCYRDTQLVIVRPRRQS